ncbi:hypothetical protein RI065_03955 [Mycoplasmatota bacterium zrk1]
MKKLLTLLVALVLVLSLSACADYAQNFTENSETNTETPKSTETSEYENQAGVYTVMHIAGHGAEVESPVYVLFEYPTMKFTKYQIAFTSCT